MEGQQQNSSGAIVVAGLPQTLLIPWHRISSYHEAATTTVGHALSYIKETCGIPDHIPCRLRHGTKWVTQEKPLVQADKTTVLRFEFCGGLKGGKGGFGANLRAAGKHGKGGQLPNYGACRDLSGRRLRHVNDQIRLHAWASEKERERRGRLKGAYQEPAGAAGIPGWFLSVPSWSEGLTNKQMRRRQQKLHRQEQMVEERRQKEEEEKQREEIAKNERRMQYINYHAPSSRSDEMADAVTAGLMNRKSSEKTSNSSKRTRPGEAIGVAPSVGSSLKLLSVLGDEEDVTVRNEFTEGSQSASIPLKATVTGMSTFGTAYSRYHMAPYPVQDDDADKENTGKWYFEIKLLTDGVVQVGWVDSSFGASTDEGDGVGDHEHSWGFDGARQQKWNVDNHDYGQKWKKGDIVGCGVDLREGFIWFSLNGNDLGKAFEDVCDKIDGGIFAAVSVEESESVEVNLGKGGDSDDESKGFAYAPENYQPLATAFQGFAMSDVTLENKKPRVKVEEVNSSLDASSEKEEPAKAPETTEKSNDTETVDTSTQGNEARNGNEQKPLPAPQLPAKLETVESPEELEQLDLQKLKSELYHRGLKCSGTVSQRVDRLWKVKGLSPDSIPNKLRGKNFPGPLYQK